MTGTRPEAIAGEVETALRELESVGRRALVLGPQRYTPRSRWISRRRILAHRLTTNRLRLLAISCTALAGAAWLIEVTR